MGRSLGCVLPLAVILAIIGASVVGTTGHAAKVKITFATSLAGWTEMVAAVAEFEREYSHIAVDLVALTGGQEAEGLLRFAAAGNMPDVFTVLHDILPGLLSHNLVKELRPLFTEDGSISVNDYVGLDMGPPGLWALPLTVNVWNAIFNHSLFAKYGLAEPFEGWTMADFRQMALKLTADTSGDGHFDQWGYEGIMKMAAPNSTDVWLWPFGASLFDDNGRAALNAQAANEALSFWDELLRHGMNRPWGLNGDDAWIGGRVAMGLGDRVWLAEMSPQLSFEWGLIPLPFNPHIPRATVGTGHFFAIANNCRHTGGSLAVGHVANGP